MGGATAEIGPTTGPSEVTGTKADEDGVESSRSDAPQQLSASDWLTTGVASAPGAADLCIGQVLTLTQQAIRASGVASHPAQRPKPPADKKQISVEAAMRRMNSSTGIG